MVTVVVAQLQSLDFLPIMRSRSWYAASSSYPSRALHSLTHKHFLSSPLQLGFYQEQQADDRNHATRITFTPLHLTPVTLSTVDIDAANAHLTRLIAQDSTSVYSMAGRTEGAGGEAAGRENMKQDAMVHYWLSEIALDDEDFV